MATAARRRQPRVAEAGDEDIIVPEELDGAFSDAIDAAKLRLSRDNDEARRVADMIEASMTVSDDGVIAKNAPWLADLLENPQVHQALGWAFVVFANYIYPNVLKAWKLAVKIHSTTEVELLNAAYGLGLAFFGGHFAVSIAALEAWKMSGWETTQKALEDLHANYSAALEAHKKDNEEDLDGDGIADVDQITREQLVKRKMSLFVKTIDPQQCSSALTGLWVAWLSVMTTLKFQYAKTVALGASLGEMLRRPAAEFLVPVLVKVLPKDYFKWINVMVGYSCKATGITVAWAITSIQSAFQSAIKGGFLFATAILSFLQLKGHIPKDMDLEKMHAKEGIAAAVAIIGLWWQLSNGLTLPFPINLLMIPFRVLEWFLRWQVSTFEMPASTYA